MRIVLILLLAAAVAGGCGARGADDDGRLRVVATTEQLADVAREIGGDRVAVETLLDTGADPHDFEPRPSDARAVAEADVVLRSGGEVDEWLADLVESAGGDAEVVDVADAIGVETEDPHWWQ